MDGTNHNITAYGELGAVLRPANLPDIKTAFPHPCDASFAVFAFPDPPHNIKLVRNALHHYGYFVWPGRGTIKWEYIANLAELQEEHGLRLGNKLTSKHANFQRNKMRVKLAVQVNHFATLHFSSLKNVFQAVASDSVARSLRWAHTQQIAGFAHNDVITTAEFLELHDKLFDIMNSKGCCARRFKKALVAKDWKDTEEVFSQIWDLYSSLQIPDGKLAILSKRKTGFLGFLACIVTVRGLLKKMEDKVLTLNYLATYKMSQDHLEIFFNAVRYVPAYCKFIFSLIY